MKAKTKKTEEELRPEYDFDYSKAVRGKYYKRILSLLDLTKTTQRLTKKSSRRGMPAH